MSDSENTTHANENSVDFGVKEMKAIGIVRRIEEYGKYTKTKKFVEDMAKEKLGLVKDDEIVFKEGD